MPISGGDCNAWKKSIELSLKCGEIQRNLKRRRGERSSDLGGATVAEAEAKAAGEVGEAAEELAEGPIHHAALAAERRRAWAPLGRRRGRHGRGVRVARRRRGAELVDDGRPVGEAARGRRVGGVPAEPSSALAVERRRVVALGCRRRRRRRRRRLRRVRGVLVLLLPDLHAGEEETAVRGDEGVGRVHRHVAAPAQQRAVLEAEEVRVALLKTSNHRSAQSKIQQEQTSTTDRTPTWHMSHLGGDGGGGAAAAAEEEEEEAGERRGRRRCFPARRLAAWMSRAQRAHRAASSAQQRTLASAAAHALHSSFMRASSAAARTRAPPPVVVGEERRRRRWW